MTNEQPIQETEVIQTPTQTEAITEVLVDPIYKHKDGRIFTKNQLIAKMGLTEDRIKDGLSKGMITQVGDTDDPTQQFKHKDGRIFSMKEFAAQGVNKDRVAAGIERGMIVPIEKKNQIATTKAPLETPPPKPEASTIGAVDGASVSTTPPAEEKPVEPTVAAAPPTPAVEAPITPPVEEQVPVSIFDEAKQYSLLKNKKKTAKQEFAGAEPGVMESLDVEVDDKDAQEQAKKMKEAADAKGVDYDVLDGVNKIYDENHVGFNIQIPKEELEYDYLNNKARFDQKYNLIKSRQALSKTLRSKFSPDEAHRQYEILVGADDNVIQNASTFAEFTSELSNNTNQLIASANVGDYENKKEILADRQAGLANMYADWANKHPESFEVDPLNRVLNSENKILGWHFVQDLNPEEIGKYRAALIPDEDIKDNWQAQTAKQQATKQLEQIGLNIRKSNSASRLKELTSELESDVEVLNGFINDAKNDPANAQGYMDNYNAYLPDYEKRMEEYNKLNGLDQKLSADYTNLNDDSQYGYANYYERQGILQDLTEQNRGFLTQPFLKLGQAGYNTGAMFVDFIKAPFLSDRNKEVDMATIMGTNIAGENELRLSPKNQLGKIPYVMKPDFEVAYDYIMNSKSLSDQEKQDKVYDLIINNPDGLQINPKGRETNLTLGSLWYGMTNLAADLAPYLFIETLTGGTATEGIAPSVLKKFSSSFIAAFTTGFHQSYLDAISRGSQNPYADAMRSATISSLAMGAAGTPDIMRKIIGTKSVVGKMINKMTDKEILAVLRTEPKALSVFKKAYNFGGKMAGATLEGFKGGTKMVTLTTAAQAINDKMYGEVRNLEEYIDDGKLEVLKFTLFGGITGGLTRGFTEKYGDLTKSAMFEAAANPKKFLDALELKIKNNDISKTDADQIRNNIETASKIFKTTYFGDSKGKPLDDASSRDLLFLKMQEADIEKIITDRIPEELEKKLTNRLLNIKEKINDLRDGIEAPERKYRSINVLTQGDIIAGDIIKNKEGIAGEVLQVNDNKTVVIKDIQTGEKFLWKPEDIAVKAPEPVVKPIPTFGPPTPRPTTPAPTTKQEEIVAPEPDSNIIVGDLIDKAGSYNGKKGVFYLDGQTVVFKEEGTSKEYDLGYINDIKDTPINQYGIQHEESVVSANEDGTFTIRGNTLRNGYSDPMQAINRDAEGNIMSVTLDMPNGTKRTFRGNVAEDLAYQIHLKEITKDNATAAEFEQFINEPEQQQQVNITAVPEVTAEGTATVNEPVQRETLTPTVPATAEPIITGVEETELIRQAEPDARRMVDIEREFENRGYTIDTIEDNEIQIMDKDGEQVEGPEDLPKELRGLAAEYEALTAKLGDVSDVAREKALIEARKVTEVEAEVVEPETKKIERITETQEISTTRNTIAPKGVKQGGLFPGNRNKIYDATKEYPELTKYNDKNLNTASSSDLWNLMQMHKPSDFGFKVSRNAMIKEFNKRGLSMLEDLGFPTDENAMYKYNSNGDVEKLSSIVSRASEGLVAVIENWMPVLDYKKEIEATEKKIIDNENKLSLTKDKDEKNNLQHYIKVDKESLADLKNGLEKGLSKTEETKEIKAGGEVEFKTAENTTAKGIKVEIPGLENLDTILVQDGMTYEVYELTTGMKLADTENAMSPAEAVKTIANNIPSGIAEKILNKIYEGEEAGRYKIAGEKKGINIINESPAYNAFKQQKIAEAENKPFVHNEETRTAFLDLARQAKEEGIENASNMFASWANIREGKGNTPFTIEQAKQALENYRKRNDLAERKSKNIPYPEKDIDKSDPSEEGLIKAIQQGYKRDRWNKLPEEIKKAALEAWRKEAAIYNKYGYYPSTFTGGETFFGTTLTLGRYIGATLSKDASKREGKIKEDLRIMQENFKRIDEIYKQEGLDVLKAEEGQTPKPLTVTETPLPSGAQAAFNKVKNRKKQAPKEGEQGVTKEEQKVEKTLHSLAMNFYKNSEAWPTGRKDGVVITNNKTSHGTISILAKPDKGQSKEAFIDLVKQWGKNNGLEFTELTYDEASKTERINFAPIDAAGKKFNIEEVNDVDYDQARDLIGKPATLAASTAPAQTNISNAVVDFPTNQIKTNIEEYQGRKTLFSERSARNVAENFDRNKFDPIVIYKHPDGNTYVLSGHSRFEGMRRRGEATIPARIFEGTPEEAKDFALKSNKLGTLQTDIENAAYYREQLNKGKSYSAVMSEAKENEQSGSAKRIVSYAHLNPNGKMMNALAALEGTEGDSSSNLSAIATKIGDIRANNPHLTDAHENELYDFMISDKDNIPTDKELQDANSSVNRSIAAARFDNTEPLNLKKTILKSAERQAWEKEKEDLETQIREYKKEVNANKTTNWSGLKEKAIASLAKNKTQEAIDKALEDFNNNVNGIKTQYEKVLAQKKLELKSLEDKLAKHLLREKGLIEGEKSQQSLFSYRETRPEDFEDYVEGVTDMINESPEKTLQQVQAEVANYFGDHSPEFKKIIEQAFNEAKNNVTGRIVKTEILQKLNKGFLKIGSTIFDNEQQLIAKAKQLSGSRFNALDNTAGFETRDGKPLGFNYDTDQVARERFDFSKLKRIGEGSDRVVFDLGNGKVLKVAKTARGLEQNIYEGDGYLDFIPEVYERGLNYVVTDNIPRIKGTDLVPIFDGETGQEIGTVTAAEMFKDLNKFHQGSWDRYDSNLQTILEKYGFGDVRGYEILYGDFSAARNWGYKDGKPYLIDAGTLGGVDMIQKYRGVKNLSDPDFRKIYYESKQLKKQYVDADKYTKFHYDENGEILGFTHGGHIYLNGQKITAKTTMEEAGHIWVNHAKETNSTLYNSGLKKVLGSQYLKDVMSSEFYKKEALKQGKEGSKAYNDYMQEEALAKAISDEGAKFVTDAQRISFKEWVSKMWDNVMKAFGIRDLTPDQVAKLSLKDFAKMAAADVFAEGKTETAAPEVKPAPKGQENVTVTETTQNPEGERITRTETVQTKNPYLYEGTEERQRGLYTHLMEADSVSQETKNALKKNGITYQAANNAQAELMAEDILKTYNTRDALQIARGSDVHASVRSAIFAKLIDAAYVREMRAKTPEEKMRAAQQWKDLVTEYANQLTAGGQFTAYAAHFYRTSPMGFVMKENADREGRFNEWSKGKEKTLEELWNEINATAEGRSLVNLEVKKAREAEREAERKIRDKKIDDFFDKLKINPKNTYGFIIPLGVLNPVIDGMKLAVKAGDRVADVVQRAIEQISDKVGNSWDKEAFRKDYEEMLTGVVGKVTKESDEAAQLRRRLEGLEKQISDLKEKISKGGETGKKKEIKFSDNAEVQKLIEERDQLKKENEDLLKNAKAGKYSDEAKIKAAKEAVLKSIEETKRKIIDNDLSIKKKEGPTDAELTAHREEQKRLRKELEDMRKEAQEGKYDPVEMAKAEAKRKQARIDELNRRINENDFSAEKEKMEKQKTALDDELAETKRRYNEARKQSPEYKEKKSKQFLDKLRKRLEGLSERQRNEIVQRSLKQITEAGGLNYEDFRKIVAESMGYKDLTPAEVAEVEALTKTINSVEDAEDALVANPTEANLKALDKARQDAMTAGLKLYNKTHRPADIPRTFGSLITGSLLGVVTLSKNVIQNIVMQATMRVPKALIIQPTEAALVWLGNKFSNSKAFNTSSNIVMAQKGYFKGAGRGIKRGWFNFYKGTQERDYFGKVSYQSTLAPREAVKDLKMYFSGQKPLNKTELTERMIRATLGWQPDFILRAMGFGDRPFRWAAEGAAAIQIAKLELKLADENEINAFMYAPKKFAYKTLVDQGVPKDEALLRAAEMEDRIIEAGSKAVLEQENVLSQISKFMDQGLASKKDDSRLMNISKGAASILKTTTFPFVKIPANVYWQMFKIANPEVAMLQSLYHGGKAIFDGKGGDKAEARKQYEYAKDNMATAVLGYGVSIAIASLVTNGYVRPENDDETKAREREGEKPYEKGNQLNWGRLMGGDDYWIDLTWFGPIGTTMGVQAKIQEQNRRKQLKGEVVDTSWAGDFSDRFTVAEMESLNQLVYDQAGRTIGAVKGGENGLKVWAINSMNTGMNIITGATYTQMSKAMLPTVPRLKSESIMEEFKSNQQQRNALYRMYSGMPPARVSIWGDPIKQDNSFWGVVGNMLGFQESDAHQFGAILYYDAQRTGDTRFFPTAVTDKVTVDGVEIKLTQDQKDELATYIGQARKMLVGSFVYDCALPYEVPVKGQPAKKLKYNDKDMTDADKINALEKIYNYGKEIGFAQFQKAHIEFAPAELTPEQLGAQIKREVYDEKFKMGLEKAARAKGKEIPSPTKEEELQRQIDEQNEELRKLRDEQENQQ